MSSVWQKGKPCIAFISGGASGLGLHIAKFLIKEGTSVAIFDLGSDKQFISELRSIGVNKNQKIEYYQADVSDPKL